MAIKVAIVATPSLNSELTSIATVCVEGCSLTVQVPDLKLFLESVLFGIYVLIECLVCLIRLFLCTFGHF
jgi:hypothetical protein